MEDQLTIRYRCWGGLNAETRCAELLCASAMVALLCSVASSLFLLRAFLVSAHSRLCTPFSLSPREKAAPPQRKPPPTREEGEGGDTAPPKRETRHQPKGREGKAAPLKREGRKQHRPKGKGENSTAQKEGEGDSTKEEGGEISTTHVFMFPLPFLAFFFCSGQGGVQKLKMEKSQPTLLKIIKMTLHV